MRLGSELMATLLNEKHSQQVTDPRHRHRFVRGRYESEGEWEVWNWSETNGTISFLGRTFGERKFKEVKNEKAIIIQWLFNFKMVEAAGIEPAASCLIFSYVQIQSF
jgi:hypothetical protein